MEASTALDVRAQIANVDRADDRRAPAVPQRLENGWGISKDAGIETIQECSRAVQGCLVQEVRTNDQPGSSLGAILPALRDRCASMARFIQALNAPEPGAARDIEIGRALLPLAILAMSQLKLDTNAACLYDLYLRTHIDEQTGDAQISFPSWLLGTYNFLAVKPIMDKLPDASTYLEKSPSLAGNLLDIQRRLGKANEELEKFQTLNEKTNAAAARGGHETPDTYTAGIAKWEAIVRDTKNEIPPLFNALFDVMPEDLPESVGMLAIKVAMKPELLQGQLQFTKDLEQLIEGALCSKKSDGIKVSVPQVAADGTYGAERFVYTPAELDALKNDPAAVVQIIHTYLTARAFLRTVISTIEPIPELRGMNSAIHDALRQPFTRERGKEAMDWLIRSNDPAVREGALAILADPVTPKDGKPGTWGHQLEDTGNIRPVMWAASSYVTSHTRDGENGFLQVMNAAPELMQHLTPFLARFKRAYETKNFGKVAKILSDEIASARASKSFYKLLAPLTGLAVIAADTEAARRLKNQIPNITELKDIVPGLVAVNEHLAHEIRGLVDTVVRGVSVSMHDYYQDPKMEELWKFLSKFKLFLRHPTALDGLSGNEGMKSGILVAGKPGVGKSFFVKCLENELNIKSFTISPDQGERSAQKIMIDACRSIIEAAKKHASNVGPCILFIDEAEAVMADRGNPRVTNDQIEITCYLLQEINLIREKFPKILIIAATNYPDKIDEGMLRDGRFDIHVLMDLPPAPLREYIVRSTLKADKIKLDLSSEQMARLVEITDGMMPLPIKRTIFEANRLGKLEAQESNRPFELTFDLLVELYTAEKELKRFRLAERMKSDIDKDGSASKPIKCRE